MKYKLSIGLTLFLLAIILIFLLILPKQRELTHLQTLLQEKKFDLQNWSNRVQELKNLQNQLKAKGVLVEKVNTAFTEKDSTLTYFLQQTAFDNGLLINSFEIFVKESEETINQKIIKMELLGSYFAFKNFLTTLQNSALLFEINKMMISKKEKGEMVFQLELITPFFEQS